MKSHKLLIALILLLITLVAGYFVYQGKSEKNIEVSATQVSDPIEEQTAMILDDSIIGTYTSAVLPSADSVGRVYSLILNSDLDRTAVFTSDYKNDQPIVTENGVWDLEAEGILVVTLSNEDGTKNSLTFEQDVSGNKLTMMQPDVDQWGDTVLVLNKTNPSASSNTAENYLSNDTPVVYCDEDGNRYNTEAEAQASGLSEAQYGATYCPEYQKNTLSN